MKCRDCQHFEKQSGSKSRNTDKGLCKFLSVERSKNRLADNTQKVENLYTIEEREPNAGVWRTSKNYGIKNTKSVEVVKCAFGLYAREEIVSDVHFWCDGDFFCAAFCPF